MDGDAPSPSPAPSRSRSARLGRLARLDRHQLVAIASFLAALVLALVWGFPSERGWHFDAAHAKTDRTGTYDLAKARMLARVVGHLRAHYVSPERVDPKRMVAAAMWRVQAEVPEVRVRVLDAKGAALSESALADTAPRMLHVTVGEVTREFPLDKLDDLFELNWKLVDVFEFLERHLPPHVDLESLEYSAVNGLLATLDPHTVLLTPRHYRELQLSQKGRFGGLGITVGEVDGYLVIQQVMRDTPAADAGLQVDDRIVQIDGVSTISMGLEEGVNLMRGEPGSEVVLWIMRPRAAAWDEARPFKVVRREIQLPSVSEASLGDGIGWVHVRGFQETTDSDLEQALSRLEHQPGGLKGLVLDLRDNPGGLLDKAIAVSDAFIDSGTIVTTVREGGRERDESHATELGTRTDLPIVVLVNRGSASASEIVAGAFKRNDRALIVGQRTFGKGSVQVIYRIDEAALKLTVAQYLTPGDVSIQGVGIVPDIDLLTLRGPANTSGEPFDGRMDLHPAPETHGGEASLTAHLDSARTRVEAPAIVLRLLEEQRTPMHHQRLNEARVPDAAVRLAKDILRAAPAVDRKQALVQLAGFFSPRQEAENARIESALRPAGIDWRAGPPAAPGDAKLDVALELPREVSAGGSLTARLSVKNLSKKPLGRLHAELETGIPALDGRELAIGYLEPGARVERTLTMKLPAGVPRMGDDVVVRLYSDGVALSQSVSRPLAVVPVASPVFSHTVQIDDTEASPGNGDGLLQRGERIRLRAYVSNIGQGPAKAVLATLRNESGPEVFIHMGRNELGALEPGQTRVAEFELEVKKDLKARLVELGLEVNDTAGSFYTGGPVPIELAIFPDALPSRTPRTGFAMLPKVATRLHAGASRDAPEIAEVNPGAVLEVAGEVGDWLEVRWQGGGFTRRGYLPRERVRLADAGGVTRDAAHALAHHRPPVLDLELTPAFTEQRDLALKGVARFAATSSERRLIYIFNGRDKVYFRAANSLRPEVREDAATVGFDASLALSPGPNEITVIAREGEESVARMSFVVFRR